MAIILAEMNIVSKKKIEEEETKERYRYIMVIVLKSLVHTATLKGCTLRHPESEFVAERGSPSAFGPLCVGRMRGIRPAYIPG
jgi:hypothetical protein